ncbi:MAG: T9SS type A sorting domain-containing protein [Lewinella sp.]
MNRLLCLVLCLCASPLAADCTEPGPDLQPLLDLYQSANGPNWINRSGWELGNLGLDCDYCQWAGVVCSPEDRVIALNLEDNNLSGSLPQSFSELDQISRLNLKRANIGSSISELEGLNRLQTLDLFQVNYTGPFPAFLQNLPFLSKLDMANNQMNGQFPDLSGAPLLRELHMDANNFTGPPPTFENMNQLREVTMQRNEFEGRIPETWTNENLPRLEILDARFGTISGPVPTWLGTLAGATINLGNNLLSGCYPEGLASFCGNNPPYLLGNSGLPSNGSQFFFNDEFCQQDESCGPCPPELIITHDSILTNFRALYPNCTDLAGDLSITGNGITELRGVESITTVGGSLLVEDTDISNLEGLNAIDAVAGDWIVRNASLSSVRPLKTINSVGGDLIFEDLPNLSGNGFSGQFSILDILGSDFRMINLPQLTSLQGFGNLNDVPGTLQLEDLDAMTTFDGPGYLSIYEVNTIQIYNNDRLEHVDFFRDLAFLHIQNLLITGNPELRNLNGFDEAERIDRFGVVNNPQLSKCAIPPVCLGFDPDNPVTLFFSNNAYGCEDTNQIELDCDGSLPLPVDLINFRAYAAGKVNRLEWTVENEIDLDFYSLERSTDEGLSWREHNRVSAISSGASGGAAAGAVEVVEEQSTGTKYYATTDPAPVRQTFYRLRITDLDGTFAYSPIVAVQRTKTTGLRVAPNPSFGSFVVDLPATAPATLTLHNAAGREVWRSGSVEGTSLRVATGKFPTGVYFIRVKAGAEVFEERVVVR